MQHGRLLAGLLLITSAAPRLMAAGDSTSSLEGPYIGFLARSSPAELRAILGIPGAAVLSDPLPLPADTTRVRLAPGHKYALIESAAGDTAVLPLGRTFVDPVAVPDAIRSAENVVFSPGGTSALLFTAADGGMVLGGLPNAPRAVLRFTADAIPEDVGSFAVNDGGTLVLAGGKGGHMYVVDANGAREVYPAGRAGALAFVAGTNDAVYSDVDRHGIFVLRNVANAGEPEAVFEGFDDIVTLLPMDAQSLLVTGGAGAVFVLNTATHEVHAVAGIASSAPPLLMHSRKTVLLSAPAGEPAWLADLNEVDAKVFFVPAAVASPSTDPEL